MKQTKPHRATPLLIASGFGHVDVVRELLEAGASVHQTDEDGDAALHGACAMGVLETCVLLLDKGADVNLASNEGTCPLLIAVNLTPKSQSSYTRIIRRANQPTLSLSTINSKP